MKKIGITLLTAFFGGAVAIGGYKLIENNNTEKMSIEERQKVYFTNNPMSVSSAGDVDFVQAAAAVTPAVVHIQTTYGGGTSRQQQRGGGDPFEDMFRDFFGGPRNTQRAPAMASGSGVIVTDDGYIVTNNHVVEDASKIEVILPDKRSFQAKVIGRDPNTDLALIKVTASKLPVVKLGNSDNVQVGEWVLAVGYPLTLNTTVTAGIVSAKGRSIGIIGQPSEEDYYNRNRQQTPPASSAIESFIQTDAAINRGNSGGALVNTRGELIGINAAIASQTGYYAGYGFAIPVNLAKKIMDDFIKFGTVKRGYLGINFPSPTGEDEFFKQKNINPSSVKGVYVSGVQEGGAAAAAGLKEGDIITGINGTNVTSSSEFSERIARHRPGDKVELTYQRDGKSRTVTATLKGEESLKLAGSNKSAEEIYNTLGASFSPVSGAQKQRYKINSGVVVTEVRDGGLFSNFGIEKGSIITSINDKPIAKVDDIDNALTASRNNMLRISGISADGARMFWSFPISQ